MSHGRGTAGGERIETAIRAAGRDGRPAIAAFLTAGFPSRRGFDEVARVVAETADLLELGVPFSDPMADGITIQEASRAALAEGVTLPWILDLVESLGARSPVVLMSYLNPLLAFGYESLARRAADAGVSGFIVPDLPLEESAPLRDALGARGVALIQLVTPLSSPTRRARLAAATDGFLYAVTRTGTTGGTTTDDPPAAGAAEKYLAQLRRMSARPVLAGFGIRSAAQVRELGPHVDGFIVGSALIERLAGGDDPAELLTELKGVAPAEAGR